MSAHMTETRDQADGPARSCPEHRRALDFLWSRINYERTSAVPYTGHSFKLTRMRRLLDLLGNPQDAQQIVHIGGTKGKGSTAAMISAVLTAAGNRTGTYSSPHLDHLEERMSIDDCPCSPEELVALVERVRPVVEQLDANAEGDENSLGRPTYFEVATAMALFHFAQSEVDATVLEVGLGGRLDSTNVCKPLVSVITNISLDHIKQLGSTHAAIAGEKAGIIKRRVPVVSGVTVPEARAVIERVAKDNGSSLLQLDRDFTFDYRPPKDLQTTDHVGTLDMRWLGEHTGNADYEGIMLSLVGRHQAANAAVALATVETLRKQGWDISETAIRDGLAQASCPARVEVVRGQPTVVIDAAHNVASIEALLATLDESFSCRRRVLVFATTQDKDCEGMLRALLPAFDTVVLTRYRNNPRYVPPEELADIAAKLMSHGQPMTTVCNDPVEAWQAAQEKAATDDLICVTGSFFIAAEIRQLIRPAVIDGAAVVADDNATSHTH